MNIHTELHDFKKTFDAELAAYLDRVIAESAQEDRFVAHALTYFKKTVLAGGKRIRPAIMYYGYIAAGGTKRRALLTAAVGIELVHAFLLMHDDIIDRDALRHGKRTMHTHYARQSKNLFRRNTKFSDAEHFGLSVGIIIGDLVHALGNRAIFESGFPPERIVQALQKTSSIVGLTATGEMQDIYIEHNGAATEQRILAMYEKKTARYTFEGPFHLGATLAGGDAQQQQQFSRYAIPLGVAFQLQDDLLGLFGSEAHIGKPVGSDIAEGKITVPVAYAQAHASARQRAVLARTLGNQHLNKKDIADFRAVITDTGAEAYTHDMIADHVSRAAAALDHITLPLTARDFFAGLLAYLSERKF